MEFRRGERGRPGTSRARANGDGKVGGARGSKCVSANQRFGVPIFAFLSY